MTISLSPTEEETTKVLGDFLAKILPSGTEILVAQLNRVPEAASDNFVMMNPIRRRRLGTNSDQFVDARFQAAISGTTLNISAVSYGSVAVGSVIFGVGVADGTTITALGTGHGGVGTYTINNLQTVSSEVMAAGVLNATQATEVVIQIDTHGELGGNYAQIISTMIRDDYACQFFAAQDSDVAPLHADDPKQIPFFNENEQYENRWVIETFLQVNATVNDIPQQFFEQIVASLIPADIVEPA